LAQEFTIMNPILILAFLVAGASAQQGCWTTGCQPYSWASRGCNDPNMDQSVAGNCDGGQTFKCCPKGSNNNNQNNQNQNNQNQNNNNQGSGNNALASFAEFKCAVENTGKGGQATQAQYDSAMKMASKGLISTKAEFALFLATIVWESVGLQFKAEWECTKNPNNINCPNAYRYGGEPPGKYFYGRGYIQLSWIYNYRDCSQDLFGDQRLVNDPDSVANSEDLSWGTAYWFWKTRVHNQNKHTGFGPVLDAVNGGLECPGRGGSHGQNAALRWDHYTKVAQCLGTPALTPSSC